MRHPLTRNGPTRTRCRLVRDACRVLAGATQGRCRRRVTWMPFASGAPAMACRTASDVNDILTGGARRKCKDALLDLAVRDGHGCDDIEEWRQPVDRSAGMSSSPV